MKKFRRPDIFAVASLAVLALALSSCKNSSDGADLFSEPAHSAGSVVVFYSPNGLGDNSYMDLICYGAHRAALERNLTVYDVCPSDWNEVKKEIDSSLNFFSDPAHAKNGAALFIFTDIEYLSRVQDLKDKNFKGISFLLLESDETDLPFLSTMYMPLYGASYLAGVASRQLLKDSPLASGNKTPRVLTVLGNSAFQLLLDALNGFAAGYGANWNGKIYDYTASENLYDDGGVFSALDFAVMRLSTGVASEADPFGFDSASKAYAQASLFQKKAPFDLYFPVCGGSAHGLLRYNREKGAKSFYTVGMDSDFSVYTSQTPFSVVKHVDNAVYKCVMQWALGGAIPHHQVFNLGNGGTSLVISERHKERLSGAVSNALAEAIQKEREYEASK